jgi:hypothetical protein
MNLRRPLDVANVLGFSHALDLAPKERPGDWVGKHADGRAFLWPLKEVADALIPQNQDVDDGFASIIEDGEGTLP